MLRMLNGTALVGALLVVFPLAVAVADVTMDPAPEINVYMTQARAYPTVILWVYPSDEDSLYYTISDKDTFTPAAPPPPPPPYGGSSLHDDTIKLTGWVTAQEVPGTWQCSITPGTANDWATSRLYTVYLRSLNDTGNQLWANFAPLWSDQALGPMGIPGNQVHGSADDTDCTFTKQVILLGQ
ncbi:MAG: hypothetical protein HPY69_05930 [Armatimonadetes bacterium]|nr:hypothetical protein [Armatimonadota bacterium]